MSSSPQVIVGSKGITPILRKYVSVDDLQVWCTHDESALADLKKVFVLYHQTGNHFQSVSEQRGDEEKKVCLFETHDLPPMIQNSFLYKQRVHAPWLRYQLMTFLRSLVRPKYWTNSRIRQLYSELPSLVHEHEFDDSLRQCEQRFQEEVDEQGKGALGVTREPLNRGHDGNGDLDAFPRDGRVIAITQITLHKAILALEWTLQPTRCHYLKVPYRVNPLKSRAEKTPTSDDNDGPEGGKEEGQKEEKKEDDSISLAPWELKCVFRKELDEALVTFDTWQETQSTHNLRSLSTSSSESSEVPLSLSPYCYTAYQANRLRIFTHERDSSLSAVGDKMLLILESMLFLVCNGHEKKEEEGHAQRTIRPREHKEEVRVQPALTRSTCQDRKVEWKGSDEEKNKQRILSSLATRMNIFDQLLHEWNDCTSTHSERMSPALVGKIRQYAWTLAALSPVAIAEHYPKLLDWIAVASESRIGADPWSVLEFRINSASCGLLLVPPALPVDKCTSSKKRKST